MVIPYLSILEQTIEVYREALQAALGDQAPALFVLEDSSLAGTRSRQSAGPTASTDGADERQDQSRLLAQNWDAPIVVTTSVQFLESLFANRPGPCRKLHRLADSVVLFDEVQTLPTRLALPTLSTLSRLAERYGANVLFSTATQPAFSHLDAAVRRFCAAGWQPREIVPADLRLFDRARRTKVSWPSHQDDAADWAQVADWIGACDQALCVVNLKRHALALFEELRDRGVDGLFHLSTNMCPAHRACVLGQVRACLVPDGPRPPCRLVSTQCVEAGVDIDFPVVFRAWGPLEAIAQAAGRCNRNGCQGVGEVRVFRPAGDGSRAYPDDTYAQAAQEAWALLQRRGASAMDLNAPELFSEYYRELYDLRGLAETETELDRMVLNLHFAEVTRCYRVIATDAINVLVPYRPHDAPDVFEALADEVRATGLTRDWIARARPLPRSALAAAAYRARIAVLQDETPNHARMGLIRAYHVRQARRKGGTEVSDDVSPYLNENHPSPAYQCGRLMALLAAVQRAALGDVGAGVVQRYYAAASSTPALVLGRLVRTAQFHLGKIGGGLAYWYDGKLASVWSRLRNDVPRTLTLEEQSLFALGYYQQLADLRAGNKTSQPTAASDEPTQKAGTSD